MKNKFNISPIIVAFICIAIVLWGAMIIANATYRPPSRPDAKMQAYKNCVYTSGSNSGDCLKLVMEAYK